MGPRVHISRAEVTALSLCFGPPEDSPSAALGAWQLPPPEAAAWLVVSVRELSVASADSAPDSPRELDAARRRAAAVAAAARISPGPGAPSDQELAATAHHAFFSRLDVSVGDLAAAVASGPGAPCAGAPRPASGAFASPGGGPQGYCKLAEIRSVSVSLSASKLPPDWELPSFRAAVRLFAPRARLSPAAVAAACLALQSPPQGQPQRPAPESPAAASAVATTGRSGPSPPLEVSLWVPQLALELVPDPDDPPGPTQAHPLPLPPLPPLAAAAPLPHWHSVVLEGLWACAATSPHGGASAQCTLQRIRAESAPAKPPGPAVALIRSNAIPSAFGGGGAGDESPFASAAAAGSFFSPASGAGAPHPFRPSAGG